MPANPVFTLTATLEDITGQPAGSTPNPARLEIALSNYGLFLPRIIATTNLAKIYQDFRSTGQQISTTLWGNDLIDPPDTYYAITVFDGNNNIVQCGAYAIVGVGTFDLSTLTQLYPLPEPPGPPTINSALEIVPYGATPVFHANVYLSFKLTLSGNPSSTSISGGVPGNLYTFCILQDGAGGHDMPWPSNTRNMPALNKRPNALTTQVCECLDDGTFPAASGGTHYDPAA